jgi:uncharacterized protein YggE
VRGLRIGGAVAMAAVVAAGCSGGTRDVSVRSGLSAPGPMASTGSAPGLTTFGTASATVPADNAVVVVAANPEIADSSTPSISDAKHGAIRDAVHRFGIDDAAVSFVEASILGSSSQAAEIRVDVHKLPKVAHDVADAVRRVVPGAVTSLVFSVNDCAAATGRARPDAIRAATLRARALADAADVRLGSIVDVTEGDASPGLTGPISLFAPALSAAPCGRPVPALSAIPQPTSLDAAPEVELHEQVTVTFALDDHASRTISAKGSAEAEAAADTAFVFVSPSGDVSFSSGSSSSSGGVTVPTAPPPLSDLRGAIVRALAVLHIPASHVEVEQVTFGGNGGYVRVEMPAGQVRAMGDSVVSAVKNALRSEQFADLQSGVLFSSSACEALFGKALTAAVRDADRRVTALAGATKVKVGPIVRVTDVPAVTTDPCNIDEAFSPTSLLLGAYGQSGPQLQPFDAPLRATVRTSAEVSRAIAG